VKNTPAIARYIILPVWAGLLVYIITKIYAIRKGLTLEEEFHTKSFLVAIGIIFCWLLYAWIPSSMYLPLRVLSVKFVVGLFSLVFSVQYVVFIISSIFSPRKTLVGLGIGAGIIRSTLAVSVVGPMCASDDGLSHDGAASIMLANTIAVVRNFLIILIVGWFLGVFETLPLEFIVPMIVMAAGCFIAAAVNYKLGTGGEEEVEFNVLSVKNILMFIVVFLVMYYLAVGMLDKVGFLGFYVLSGAAGFLYGAAHLFIVTSLFFVEKISLEVAFIGAILVSAGSILSDIPYSYFAGANKLTKILLVSEIVPVVAGILTLIYLL